MCGVYLCGEITVRCLSLLLSNVEGLWGWVHMCVEFREQLYEVNSLLSPLCGSQGINLGQEALWQVLLPMEPSSQPFNYIF